MSYVVEARQIILQYGKKHALRNFDVSLNENQIIGLIGRNGAGKTTFLKLCAGLLQPSNGEITILGQNPINNLKVLQDIIYSYSNVSHKASLTLETIVEDFRKFYKNFDSVFAYRLIEVFSLSRHEKYSGLSQGMTSAFNFICALATRARITLLDEPVLGMDISVRKKVYEILLRDYIEHPRTIIISSHILSELVDLLSELLIVDAGQVVLYKTLEEVQSMAYRVDGTKDDVLSFTEERPLLSIGHKVTGSYAIIPTVCDQSVERDCRLHNLTVSKVPPEELYLLLTKHGKELDLDCLWEEQK